MTQPLGDPGLEGLEPSFAPPPQSEKPPPPLCRCGKHWSSLVWAHCSVCHETFSRVRNFDRHRKNGVCTFGNTLVEIDGIWREKAREAGWYQHRV